MVWLIMIPADPLHVGHAETHGRARSPAHTCKSPLAVPTFRTSVWAVPPRPADAQKVPYLLSLSQEPAVAGPSVPEWVEEWAGYLSWHAGFFAHNEMNNCDYELINSFLIFKYV